MKRVISAFIVLFSLNGTATAENDPILWIDGGVKSLLVSRGNFSIDVSNQVNSDCLPNPKKLRDKMEIYLRKNGFNVANKPDFFTDDILITVLGYKITEKSCVVYLSVELVFYVITRVPFAGDQTARGNETLVPFVYKIGSVIFTGDRYSMQSRLEKQIKESADKLYLDISRAKDDIFKKFPFIKENMMKIKGKN